tara:strand:- start:151 stop:504 length:354 start_codon:yes stop_codon:yes gene_type:complete
MNKYTQDMTGTGDHIELPDPEPERYYDWMLWKLRQSPEWRKAVYGKPSFKDKLKKFLKTNSLALSLIYTIGHIIIAGTTVYVMTGATIWEAGAVALVEPALNGVWFYILHSLWKKFN